MKNLFIIASFLLLLLGAFSASAQTSGVVNGHEWVDLGLPSGTRWATCNVDATTPSQPGKLYAWGETAAKSTYSEENSRFEKKVMTEDISGNSAYDVAAAKWGNGWRMPTAYEFGELVFYCDWKYMQQGGRWGVRFTSRSTQESIFLPATGYKYGTTHDNASTCGNYWTSTPVQKNNTSCHYRYGAALGELADAMRCCGLAIRPVLSKAEHLTVPASGQTNGHEWVDLGLPSGVKWATCNLGATAPELFGLYYAWGDLSHTSDRAMKSNRMDNNKNATDISGNPQYDAAIANWGEGWRMPTEQECNELIKNCTCEYVVMCGCEGCKFTSKINGNWIFLPSTGSLYNPSSSGQFLSDIILEFPDSFDDGSYWCSTPEKVDWGYTTSSRNLAFHKASANYPFAVGVYNSVRNIGRNIRPVTR